MNKKITTIILCAVVGTFLGGFIHMPIMGAAIGGILGYIFFNI